MDAVQEALATRRDLLVMKQAQGGVTDALGINVVAWLLVHHPGPILYLTNVDKTAEELVHDRWDSVIAQWEPLRKKNLAEQAPGRKGAKDRLLVKRFTDAKLVLGGSRALSQFLSNPYAVVVFDELDSCQDEMGDGSDPIELVRRRMAAFAEARDVVMIAFAHPSERDRGAAKIYYEHSDQRRGHVVCPHCGSWVAPLWKHVRPFAREGQTQLQAERDPSCYALVAACCGVTLSNADRLKMIQRVEQRIRWLGAGAVRRLHARGRLHARQRRRRVLAQGAGALLRRPHGGGWRRGRG
jgi:phage terminase large subunit GpA-like protein